MIKAVIFDVDGVLLDSFEANLKFYQDLLSYAGYTPPTRETYKSMNHMTMFDVIKKLTKSKDEKEIQKIWLMGKNSEVRYPTELLKFPDNLNKIIKDLNDKYTLAIVTSSIKGGVFELSQLNKLKSYFKTVIYYEDTTKHKPDPEPLLLAVKKLNVKPEEAVYIGDAESDMEAAKRAGMKMIFYSKSTSFQKLPELVSSLK